jgi:formyltetrahydrofolate hydrolase
MRIVMLAQHEPVYMGPCQIEVLAARRNDIVAVAVAPERSVAGKETGEQRRLMLTMLGLFHTLRALMIRYAWRLLRRLRKAHLDARSLDRAAERLAIPVIHFTDPNDPAFLARLRALMPDILINQTEFLLKDEILAVPRIGVVNRHGAWLPTYRGRVASFWAHAAGEREIAITIHFVDRGIDTGPIIWRERFPSDPTWSYGKVLYRMWRLSPGVLLRGLARLEAPDFQPIANEWRAEATPARKFPTIGEVARYRADLRARRRAHKLSAQAEEGRPIRES